MMRSWPLLTALAVVLHVADALGLAEGRSAEGVGSIIVSDAQVAAQLVQTHLAVMTARAPLSAALGDMP